MTNTTLQRQGKRSIDLHGHCRMVSKATGAGQGKSREKHPWNMSLIEFVNQARAMSTSGLRWKLLTSALAYLSSAEKRKFFFDSDRLDTVLLVVVVVIVVVASEWRRLYGMLRLMILTWLLMRIDYADWLYWLMILIDDTNYCSSPAFFLLFLIFASSTYRGFLFMNVARFIFKK